MRRLAPVTTLFFLAPLVAEYFLGDFPIVLLPLIVALAPMYGGGALLIRELTRRTGRGWPTMMTLALAFGVLEEGLLTQSLFNPGYLDQHLLDPGFVPALGIGTLWTVFVLSLHTVWSISTPIAIVEESAWGRRIRPWLGGRGLAVTAVLFVLGSAFTFAFSYSDGHFIARPAQLGVAAAVVVVLVVIAFRLPAVDARSPRRGGTAPGPWPLFVVALAAGGAFMAGTALPLRVGVAAMLAALAVLAVLVSRWSVRPGWGRWHRFALACGALFTYSWHAFTMSLDDTGVALVIDVISHIVYALAAVGIAWLAVKRIRRQDAGTVPPTDEPERADTREHIG
jgi:hypothetical protein